MVRSLAAVLTRWSSRWVPDPFVIAILLTLVTMALVWAVMGEDPIAALGNWGGRIDDGELLPKEKGLWSLLAFGMQICITLVTGHALASAPPIRRAVAAIVDRVKTPTGALVATALVAMVAGLLNWALGLIVGALMARDMGRSAKRRGIPVHYPLLGAAGYTGLLVWHGGLSGSAPLKVSNQADIATVMPDVVMAPVPLSDTLASPLNLTVCGLLLIAVPLLLMLMRPRTDDLQDIDAFTPTDAGKITLAPPTTPAQRLEQSPIIAVIIATLVFGYLGMFTARKGIDNIGLNSINLLFLGLGVLLHANAKAYGMAVADGTKSCAGVILQFPFYAGIMGMMALSGLVTEVAGVIGESASDTTFGPLTFLAAGAVNLFVPSGGGQLAVQGPIIVEAAQTLGVPLGKAIMAFSYGDQWTNMLQPFWALPLLGITGLKVGDVIGYTAALMLLVLPVFIVPLLLF